MRRAATVGLLLAALLPVDSRAALISLTVGGAWSDNVSDTTGGLSGGTEFTAIITFDDSAPDLDPTDEGIYALSNGFHFVLRTGPYTFTNVGDGVAQVVNARSDGIAWGSTNVVGGPAVPPVAGRSGFQLTDLTGTVLASDRLSEIPWNLSVWTDSYASLSVSWGTEGGKWVLADGTITSLTATVVPEPTTASLLVIGSSILTVGAARRRRAVQRRY